MKKRLVLMMLLAGAFALSAGAQKKKELTTPVNVSYSLPKASYEVVVTMECTKYIPGPYRKYAEKELGFKPEVDAPKEEWAIKNIEVKPQYVPDEKAVYSISATADYHPVMLSLSAEGFLAGVTGGEGGVFNEEISVTFTETDKTDEGAIDIMKLKTYNHLKEVLDSNFTMQEVDKVMKKIWDPIVRYAPKTEQDNVKEAVSEIFRIRSERVKLLAAENSVPDGESLKIILQGFDKMEQGYLSLFTGKQETVSVVRSFMCTPEKAGEPVTAFRFTADDGIVGNKNVSGGIYSLVVQNVVVPAPVNAPAEAAANQPAIFYRVPAVGDLKLMRANEELLSFRVIVPQLGVIKRFPTDVISNEGLSLEFYPKYGSLKSVGRK